MRHLHDLREGLRVGGAIRGPQIVVTECVRCDDCERLYLDTAKYPHWILLRRSTATRRG